MTHSDADGTDSALEDAAAGGCRVLVLTGAGEAFCSGLDLSELRGCGQNGCRASPEAERVARLFLAYTSFPIPTIAAVHGPAIAGGAGLATICDFTWPLLSRSSALPRRALVLSRPWCLHFCLCRLERSAAAICC